MKQPTSMMVVGFEGPHCPTCHCGWFRTISALSGPLSTWVRECKHCGTQYSTNESVMLREVIEGEANFEAIVRYPNGVVYTFQEPTMDELSHRVATEVVNHQAEVIKRPQRLRPTVEHYVR